jgi:SpoVK/Ycf46/Vps4 family AAA+-type ATPase
MDVDFNPNMHDGLVLEEKSKHLLFELVRSHHSSTFATTELESWNPAHRSNDDKQGVIILLHGGPGVGKTYTARCLAESLRCPLLSVEVPSWDANTETLLRLIFHWAEKWRGIIVLESVDTFLEAREKGHETWSVSTALPIRTKFQGTLLLTTNRVGILDEMVVSRIDPAVHYPVLGSDANERILEHMLMDGAKSSKDGTRWVYSILQGNATLKQHPLNGHAISSVLRTARRLASQGEEPFRRDHIELLLSANLEFSDYNKDTSGNDAEEAAYLRHYSAMKRD